MPKSDGFSRCRHPRLRLDQRIVRRLFPMFHLSIDGPGHAVQALVGARV